MAMRDEKWYYGGGISWRWVKISLQSLHKIIKLKKKKIILMCTRDAKRSIPILLNEEKNKE